MWGKIGAASLFKKKAVSNLRQPVGFNIQSCLLVYDNNYSMPQTNNENTKKILLKNVLLQHNVTML